MFATAEIKYEFARGRENPSVIFETMAGFVSAYNQLAKLIAEAAGEKEPFTIVLDGIEAGSIVGRLKGMGEGVSSRLSEAVFSAATHTIEELTETINSEKQVDAIARTVEEKFVGKTSSSLKIEPHISRQGLASVLKQLSDTNMNLTDDEAVKFSTFDGVTKHETTLRRDWRFNGEPKEMFLENCRKFVGELRLSVKIAVNEGKAVWTFKRLDNGQTFTAGFEDMDWLTAYQSSKFGGIGAKDIIVARVSFDCYPDGKGKYSEIKNAKILKVITVERYRFGFNQRRFDDDNS